MGVSVVPARRPCNSCPYRRDVPPGVWSIDEYVKLPPYDGETQEQPAGAFMCHQQDGRLCAGWVAVHDMEESLGLRMLALVVDIPRKDLDAIIDYTTDVPLFSSGAEAAAHGLSGVKDPAPDAVALIRRLERKFVRRST